MIHAFQFQDLYILRDTESGAIHLLDDKAYAVAKAIETGGDVSACGPDKREADEILAEFAELKAQGALDAPMPSAPMVQGGYVIKSMCLHVAHDCNLRCKYCFAATGDFHGQRMLMTSETGRQALDFLMTASGNRKHLEVDLFGGEPLMNLAVCKDIVAYGRALEKRFGKEIHFTMTTNCVALNDDAIDFINREMHNVVISLDGRKDVHDALRPTVNGKGSYDLITENARRLILGRGDKEYYVRGTFTRNNLDFLEDVKALRALGFEQISLEPVVLPADSPYSILPAHLDNIDREYDALATYYLEARKTPDTWLNFFHFMYDPVGGPCLRKRINGCGAGLEYVAVTPDGELYPCHQFVGMTDWRMGTLSDGMDETVRARFRDCNVLTKKACQSCWAKYDCAGGCLANACLYGGGPDTPHDISCHLMRKRLECAIGIHVKEQG